MPQEKKPKTKHEPKPKSIPKEKPNQKSKCQSKPKPKPKPKPKNKPKIKPKPKNNTSQFNKVIVEIERQEPQRSEEAYNAKLKNLLNRIKSQNEYSDNGIRFAWRN